VSRGTLGNLRETTKATMRDIFKGGKIFRLEPGKLRSPHFFKNSLSYRHRVMRKFRAAHKSPKRFRCPLCRSSNGTPYLSYRWYHVIECQRCRLVSPSIDFSKLGGPEVYDDPDYIADTEREILATYEYRKKTYAPERLAYILEKTKLTPRHLRVLDVGCGPGYFLSHLKDRRIASKGLEVAEFLVALCRQRGLPVDNTDLRRERPRSWNVITLFDVLEHLAEPLPFFKLLRRTLTPGGFVVAYTPHIHSVAYLLMGGEQNTLLPMQHLCFFDPTSLRYLAQKSGFTVESIEYFGLDLIDYLAMKEHHDGYPYIKKLRDGIPYLQAAIDKAGVSNHLRVVLRSTKR
jgi:SAM-dependent methyltransferase